MPAIEGLIVNPWFIVFFFVFFFFFTGPADLGKSSEPPHLSLARQCAQRAPGASLRGEVSGAARGAFCKHCQLCICQKGRLTFRWVNSCQDWIIRYRVFSFWPICRQWYAYNPGFGLRRTSPQDLTGTHACLTDSRFRNWAGFRN